MSGRSDLCLPAGAVLAVCLRTVPQSCVPPLSLLLLCRARARRKEGAPVCADASEVRDAVEEEGEGGGGQGRQL